MLGVDQFEDEVESTAVQLLVVFAVFFQIFEVRVPEFPNFCEIFGSLCVRVLE